VDMGELLDFFGADPVEVEFTASSRRLAVGSKTTSELQEPWCAILGLNQLYVKLEIRTVAGPSRVLQCVFSGSPYTVSSHVRHVHVV
jgi:hypothetical protein